MKPAKRLQILTVVLPIYLLPTFCESNEVLNKNGSNPADDIVTWQIVHPKHWITHKTTVSGNFMKSNSSSFYEMIQDNVFVDKTLLLKRIFQQIKSKNVFIAAPPKWGKTINLGMISMFAKNTSKSEPQNKWNETLAYRLFVKGEYQSEKNATEYEALNNKLLISQYQDIIDDHLGRYKVVYMDLSLNLSDGSKLSYVSFLNSFKENVKRAFVEHIYLQEELVEKSSKSLSAEWLLEEFNFIINDDIIQEPDYTSLRIKDSVVVLCRCLKSYDPAAKILILFDHYEYIFNKIYIETNQDFITDEAENIISFYKDFITSTFGTFWSSVPYTKAIVTSIFPLIPSVRFLHFFTEMTMFNRYDSTYPFYGFTINEVKELLRLKGLDSHLPEVIAHYYGYRSICDLETPIFNPISIIKYMNKPVTEQYWLKTVAELTLKIHNVLKNLQFRLAFQPLLLNSSISIVVDALNSYLMYDGRSNSIGRLLRGLDSHKNLTEPMIHNIFGFLLSTGYLAVNSEQPPQPTKAPFKEEIRIRIPNEEIEGYFTNLFETYRISSNSTLLTT